MGLATSAEASGKRLICRNGVCTLSAPNLTAQIRRLQAVLIPEEAAQSVWKMVPRTGFTEAQARPRRENTGWLKWIFQGASVGSSSHESVDSAEQRTVSEDDPSQRDREPSCSCSQRHRQKGNELFRYGKDFNKKSLKFSKFTAAKDCYEQALREARGAREGAKALRNIAAVHAELANLQPDKASSLKLQYLADAIVSGIHATARCETLTGLPAPWPCDCIDTPFIRTHGSQIDSQACLRALW